MEPLLAEELRSDKIRASDVVETRAGVSFKGTRETAYRACLWSRIANRVLLPLKTFPAPNPEKLYGGVKSIRWSDHLTPKETIAVDFSSSQSEISHTHYGALKTKDAICDQLKSVQGERPSVQTKNPDIQINVYVLKDEATVSIDLSGTSLHLRGYRDENTAAPLKENLAAAILMHAGWPTKLAEARAKPDFKPAMLPAFLDPMCGSGTLVIEAAMMAAQIAPGAERKHFGFLKWRQHDSALWKKIVNEAISGEMRDKKLFPKIVGYDADFRAVRAALSNLESAELTGFAHIEKRELALCESIAPCGIFVANPPYGERLGDEEQLQELYGRLGDTLKQKFKGWEGYIFTGSEPLSKLIGLRASRRYVLYNGAIECRLFKYELY